MLREKSVENKQETGNIRSLWAQEEDLPVSLLFASHLFHFEQQIVNLGAFPAHADKQQGLVRTPPPPNTDLQAQ